MIQSRDCNRCKHVIATCATQLLYVHVHEVTGNTKPSPLHYMQNEQEINKHASKYWVWTLNNYSEEEKKAIDACSEKEIRTQQGISYICYGEEIGENGTPHLQGYVEFLKRIRLSGCRKLLPRAHFERRRGSAQQGNA